MKPRLAWIGLLLVIAAGVGVHALLREAPPVPIDPGPAAPAATPAPAPRPAEPAAPVTPDLVPPAPAAAPTSTDDPSPEGPVRGRVVSGTDPGAQPIPNAKLVLWRDHPDAWWASPPAKPLATFQADDQGRFTIPAIANAATMEVTLVVSAPGWGTHFEELHGLSPEIQHEIELEPGFTLQGTVTGADARPLAGVRVFVAVSEGGIESLYRRGTLVPGPFPQTLTGGDGRYRLDDVGSLAGGLGEVGAVDGDGFLGRAGLEELPEEGRVIDRDLRIERQGALAVQVVDPSGRSAAIARWSLVRREDDASVPGESRPRADSDEKEGRLRFANLPAGRYAVLLWPEGWEPERREVEVRTGVETALVITCRPGYRLSGTVTDRARRPVKSARLAGQPVHPMRAGHGMALHGESDAEGRFSFAGLPGGDARIDIEHHRYVSVRLIAPAGTEGLVITLWERPELRGRVQFQPGEPVPTDLKVWIGGASGVSGATVPLGPEGSFRFTVDSRPLDLGRWSGPTPPPAGREVRVVVQAAGWPPAGARSVRIAPGESADLGEYSRPPGRVVPVRVLGPEGPAVPNPRVWLAFLDGHLSLEASAGEDGWYRVENAPPWEGVLCVDGGPELPFVRRFLPARGDTPIEVRLGRGGRIRGRVTDVAGRPVEGATVLLTHVRTPGGEVQYVGMGTSLTTGPDGDFLSRALPPDTYRLQVFAEDEHAGPEVAVREGGTATADIRLPVSIRR